MSELKLSVEHIGVPARDTVALKDWYVRVLGAKLRFDNGQTPPAFFVELGGGLMIEIYGATGSVADTANNGVAGWRHLALRVDSIEGAQAELAQRGVVFSGQPKPAGGGGRVLFFADAEGNLLHLVERPKDSVFH
jgi:glyoxylase I family protein